MNEPAKPKRTLGATGSVRLRLLGALVALAAGTTALVVAVLLVRSALS